LPRFFIQASARVLLLIGAGVGIVTRLMVE